MKSSKRRSSRQSAVSALLLGTSLVAVLTWMVKPLRAAEGSSDSSQAGEKAAADDQAIRATANAYTKAFNAGDAKALGSLWTEDAEYTDEEGRTSLGGSNRKRLRVALQTTSGATLL